MAEIDHRIVLCGVICLTIIYMTLILSNHDNATISALIVGIIALSIGVIIPSPVINNKTGVLKW